MELVQEKQKIFKPQKGFQTKFLCSSADIVIGGSGAGVGKTFAELLEAIRHKDNKEFGAVFFRRTYAQIANVGGLWDESMKIYPYLGARSRETSHEWIFPEGAKVKFNHLQHEKDIYSHQGAQYPLIIFDELTHFTETMFFYLLSRNRSTCGIRPYVRATCNPDPDSWVYHLISWWIDEETGYPIPERSGVIRYFMKNNDVTVWGDTKDEVINQLPELFGEEQFKDINPHDLIKSITFIPGSIHDNKELLSKDPGYLANLLSLGDAEQNKLLRGNWKMSLDGLALCDFQRVNDMFSNHLSSSSGKYITCDAARFGRDWAVIFVWYGWEVMKIVIFKQCESMDIFKAIERERANHGIPKSNTLVDQDGVGGGVVKLGQYVGFSGGAQPLKDPAKVKIPGHKDYNKKLENYKNLKTQCQYKLAEDHVNIGDIKINVNDATVVFYEGGKQHFTTKTMHGGKVIDVRDLIKADFRSMKRKDRDIENKLQVIPKEEQKIILGGRSPDFGDNGMMRVYFDLMPKKKGLKKSN